MHMVIPVTGAMSSAERQRRFQKAHPGYDARRKARERASLLVPRHVAVVIGGASGIGRAAVRRFAEEGAHVVVADLDQAAAEAVATETAAAYPGRALAVPVDVRDDASLADLLGRTVLEFGFARSVGRKIPFAVVSMRAIAAERREHERAEADSPPESFRALH